jgi:hypothetical protein
MIRSSVLVLVTWLVAALLFWRFGPEPAPVALRDPQLAEWTIPTLPASTAEADWTDLKERLPWGAPPAPLGAVPAQVDEKPLTPPDWRILAVVASGTDHYAVVRVGKNPAVNVNVNEHFPDGSLLKRVEPDRLFLVLKGRKRVLRIYPE